MMKRPFGYTLLLICTLTLGLTRPVQAQEGSFTESFESGALVGWEYSEGAILENGVLRITPGNFAAKVGFYQLGTLMVRVRHSGSGVVILRYAMQEGSSYALILLPDSIVLEKTMAAGPEPLGDYPWRPTPDEWLQIAITVQDGQQEIGLDGQTILQVTDPGPLSGGGGIGFFVEGEAVAEFDDLQVETRAGAPAQEGEPALPAVESIGTPVPTQAGTTGRLSVSDLIAELSSTQANPIELSTFIINLALSVVFSFVLSRMYVHWGSSLSNRRRFAANFILITVTTTYIILVVRSSVALSLGLVGALSIVRFRTAIKEPEELAYLFFSIGIGIGLGDNQRLVTTLALVAAIFILGVMRLFRDRRADFNLHVSLVSPSPGKVTLEEILDTLKQHATQVRLVRYDESGRALESSFLVEFRDIAQLTAAKTALRGLSDALEITFMENQGLG